ncbi:cyclic pyranopterin phosphate synthase [Marinitoga hydrogenitolerans DSM 16785]|uniref:GTP 3',8-cyclase n=1 Tax=Marinitoga hydrogenitolerans (strain DSM 16785 / JCM 12826 / AT1271) TaxID=1122195 RepID=A0A1M5A3U2_MARH1|nr:GTP 3',8-cyclase MoaA [Marinitoga hydrogenitolerans]SHF24963.1 cyclic pyranopterin phosphate synthase [Marinitoga hydrogenitolerans DSM 16785]
MIDNFKRKIEYVRLSLTDKCNFRCNYCMSEDVEFLPENEILNLKEIENLIKILKELGFKKIRLTGGEPTLRSDIIDIAKIIKKYFGSFSLTTNGSLMLLLAKKLKENGLNDVNFSLDSLNRNTFKEITKRDDLQNVLSGLEESLKVGLKVKINTVIQKKNLSEIFDLINFSAKRKIPIRFIELMPIGNNYSENDFISENTLKKLVKEKYNLIPIKTTFGSGPSKYYLIKELNAYIGFIAAITHNFCSLCNKIRISSDGKIYPCLAFDYNISIKNIIFKEDVLKEKIKLAILKKPKRHFLHEFKKETPMHKMGG